MKQFKIRASAASQIMTNGRGSNTMGKTAQSYCQKWLKEQLYNRKIEHSNKYTAKGLIMEDDALDLVAEQFGYGLLVKNEQHYDGKHITGTPDNIQPDHTLDVKTSWSIDTFPLFVDQLDPAYWWQGQAYMSLTGRREHFVYYCLIDTPQHLIESEARSRAFKMGGDPDEIYDELIESMTYGDVKPELRVKRYRVEYDQDAINRLVERVEECRIYINSLL